MYGIWYRLVGWQDVSCTYGVVSGDERRSCVVLGWAGAWPRHHQPAGESTEGKFLLTRIETFGQTWKLCLTKFLSESTIPQISSLTGSLC